MKTIQVYVKPSKIILLILVLMVLAIVTSMLLAMVEPVSGYWPTATPIPIKATWTPIAVTPSFFCANYCAVYECYTGYVPMVMR